VIVRFMVCMEVTTDILVPRAPQGFAGVPPRRRALRQRVMAAAPHRVMAATPIVRRAFCIDPKSDSRGVEDGAGVSGARRSLVSVGTITAGTTGQARARRAFSKLYCAHVHARPPWWGVCRACARRPPFAPAQAARRAAGQQRAGCSLAGRCRRAAARLKRLAASWSPAPSRSAASTYGPTAATATVARRVWLARGAHARNPAACMGPPLPPLRKPRDAAAHAERACGAQGPHSNSLRSKTLVLPSAIDVGGTFPDWTFDGSRCGLATLHPEAHRVGSVLRSIALGCLMCGCVLQHGTG
jgi:hypothetical protein